MQTSQIPDKFPIPFANNAGAGYIRPIPEDHQAATGTDAPASLHDGFPPETFTPAGSGGIPPAGADFNGLLNQITAGLRWLSAGNPAQFDNAFAAAIGGYAKFAMLASTTPGLIWQSTAENNATDPDSGSAANWIPISLRIAWSSFSNPGGVLFTDGANQFGIMWGTTTSTANGTRTVAYAHNFAHVSFPIVSGASIAHAVQDNPPGTQSASASGFSFYSALDISVPCWWIAVGY